MDGHPARAVGWPKGDVTVSSYGPEERALFESGSADLYEEIVAAGGLAADDERIAEDGAQRRAFDLLVELGLLQLDKASGTWLPEDPTSVSSRVVSPLSQEGAKLLDESSRVGPGLQQPQPRVAPSTSEPPAAGRSPTSTTRPSAPS